MISDLKISVIIPSFNQGRFIEETLLSLLSQNYKNLEIIVIDGGSTDHTISVIKKYEKNLSYWISEKDNGQSEAINKGFGQANGEIITWLNSDDYYNEGTLTYVARFFKNHPEIDFLHGKARLFGKGKEKIIGPHKDLPLHEYFPYMRFPQPSSFFRKKLIEDFGIIRNDLHYTMDFEFVCRALLAGAKIKSSSRIFSNYRLHSESKTNNALEFLREWSMIVFAVLSAFDEGKIYARELVRLKLTEEKPSSLKFDTLKISLSQEQLQEIFLLHLNLQYHTLYQEREFESCLKISGYLKAAYPEFYKIQRLSKFDNRAKYFPKTFFKLFR